MSTTIPGAPVITDTEARDYVDYLKSVDGTSDIQTVKARSSLLDYYTRINEIDNITSRLDNITDRLDNITDRLDNITDKLDSINSHQAGIDASLAHLNWLADNHGIRLRGEGGSMSAAQQRAIIVSALKESHKLDNLREEILNPTPLPGDPV